MIEFAFGKKIGAWLGTQEKEDTSKSAADKDEFWVDPNLMNTRVTIEGFGQVQVTPSGEFLLASAQLLKLSQYEADKGLPHAESESVGDGTFLVSLPVSKSDTV